MLQRVRSDSQKKPLLPRRGRIRLILAVMVAVGLFAFVSKRKPTDLPVSQEPIPAKMSAGKEKSHPELSIGRKDLSSLSFDQVALIFAKSTISPAHSQEDLKLASGTLTAHTSLDTALQTYAKRLMRRYHPLYGAIVAMEPSTGRILALVSYNNEESTPLDNRLYCRSLFPAASIFKTITAAAALDKGSLLPASEIRHTGRNHTLYKFQLAKDLDVYRKVSLSEAFAYSMNPVFGRIGIFITGCSSLKEYARRFGFEDAVPFEIPTDTSRVGACDSAFALAELASGFNQRTTLSPVHGALIGAAIANEGRMPRPTVIDSITDARTGRLVYRPARGNWKQPVSVGTAAKLRGMMRQVSRYGTARSAFRYVKRSYRFNDMEYGGKTGSVDKDGMGKVDWFVGFIRHPSDPKQRVAVGVVTVHGAYWTVHSSFLGAEVMRRYIRSIQIAQEKAVKSVMATKESDTDG